jgi:FKBP-type peptidyl-prolyl cis-trans isomerase 2
MGCSTKKPQQATNNTNTNTSNTVCKEAIAIYLQQTKSSTDGELVNKGNTVVVDYVGRLDDQTVFDTSVESIAQACGKYSSGRNYSEGLSFTVGAGQMIAGFDKGVDGMKVGETKTVTIPAKEAYGERSEKNIIKVPREQIPDSDQLTKGAKLMSSNGQTFTIYAIDNKEVTLDANHELAGKTLIFDITIKSVQK